MGKRTLLLSSLFVACSLATVAASPSSCGGRSELEQASPAACPTSTPTGEPTSPIDYGERDVTAALQRAGSSATVRVVTVADPAAQPALSLLADAGPESYAVVADGSGGTVVVGSDAVGAMYGAFEIAERLSLGGGGVLPPSTPITGAPSMAYRSYNPYVVMPDPDGEPCWYFLDASYWQAYLDEMAHARLNFLDLHAMYNLSTTLSPNPLMWFAVSASYPDAGPPSDAKPGLGPASAPPDAERIRNAQMLETVVQMAHVRGIKVGFLSARSDLAVDLYPESFYQEIPFTQDDLVTYTREAVTDLLRRVPDLDAIGVRVGEGNALPPLPQGASPEAAAQYPLEESSFYEATYLQAIRAAGARAKFYTRSWLTSRAAIEPLLAEAGGAGNASILVKFSAEQFGPPWVPQDVNFTTAPGSASFQPSYLYEDYLDAPAGAYTFIFHVWNSASFRLFRYASYARTARALTAMRALSPRVAGFTLQAAATYGRQREYWLANADDAYSPWTFQRDELEANLYGRLGYDPSTPESTLRAVLARRVGTDALWQPEQAGSDIVAWMVAMQICGPDSRDFAPQLQRVGTVDYWAKAPRLDAGNPDEIGGPSACGSFHGPIDGFAFASAFETAQDLAKGRVTTRVTARDVAQLVLADAAIAHGAAAVPIDAGNRWARDVQRESVALADLGDYFGHKLEAATALAVYEQTGAPDYLRAAARETATADQAWAQLVDDTTYVKKFEDPYFPFFSPMDGKPNDLFHWSEESQYVARDPASVAEAGTLAQPPVFPLPAADAWLGAPPDDGPGLVSLAVTPSTSTAPVWQVLVTLASPPPPGTTVAVLWKPMATTAPWSAPIPATGSGTGYQATVPNVSPGGGSGNGGLFAVDVTPPAGPGVRGWRYPSPLDTVPYVSLPP